MHGSLGDAYTVKVPKISGYKIYASPDNLSGIFTDEDITVTLVYEKNGSTPASDSSNSGSTAGTVSATTGGGASSGGGGGGGSSGGSGVKKGGSGASRAAYSKHKKTATYEWTNVKNKAKVAKIPATVKLGKKTYKVTKVETGAFDVYGKLTMIVVGRNVKKLKSGAFRGCSKNTVLVIQTRKLTQKNVKGCLKGSKIKTIRMPEGMEAQYKSIFSKKNAR